MDLISEHDHPLCRGEADELRHRRLREHRTDGVARVDHREAEIHKSDSVRHRLNHHILRLDVAMDDLVTMKEHECVEAPLGDPGHMLGLNPTFSACRNRSTSNNLNLKRLDWRKRNPEATLTRTADGVLKKKRDAPTPRLNYVN